MDLNCTFGELRMGILLNLWEGRIMNAITVKNLTKSYQGLIVLKNLNLEIKKGEVYGFIGKNGAGKTTTINLILSLIHKDSGDIIVDNELILFTNQHYKSKIGYVPDVPVFPSYMTAKDYLIYTLEMFSSNVNFDEKIDEVLTFVSLDNNKKKISSYSRGMKQRLAIAQALIHDPEILIMDEPTSALDPIGRADVMNIILKLKGKKTIFYSTHILDDVEKVCDRIGILNEGELILEESIENLQEEFSTRNIYVQTKNNLDVLKEKLPTLSSVKAYRLEQKGVGIKLSDDATPNDLLKDLVALDIEIIEFRQVRPSVEEIFIKETNNGKTS